MDVDSAALVARCLAGDQAACTALVDAHARVIGTMIWRTTGEPDAVEDLAQEVFLRVFRALPTFRGQSKLSTWICTIAHRVAIDYVRQRAGTKTVSGDAQDADSGDTLIDRVEDTRQRSAEAALATDEMHRLIREQVALLPEKYRVPLEYAALEGMDYDTVAAMLGMPIGTVKTLVFRAKQQLRERIGRVLRGPGKEGLP